MGTGNFKPKEDLKLFSNPIKGDKLSFILELTKKCMELDSFVEFLIQIFLT